MPFFLVQLYTTPVISWPPKGFLAELKLKSRCLRRLKRDWIPQLRNTIRFCGDSEVTHFQMRFVALHGLNVFEPMPIICTISSPFHTGENLNSCACEITPNPSSPWPTWPTPAKIKLKCAQCLLSFVPFGFFNNANMSLLLFHPFSSIP